MASYLVTGVARGLGLEIVKTLARKPGSEVSTVFATLRSSPPPAFLAAAVRQVKERLDGRSLDILINNAAVNELSPGGLETRDNLRRTLEVNVEAVHNVILAFLPLLREGNLKTVLNMSSITGSLAHAERFTIAPLPAYKNNKGGAKLHDQAICTRPERSRIYVLCIFTRYQGGPYADLEAETGAKAVLDLSRDREALNGKFLNIHVPGWEETQGLHKYDELEIEW
ncbi:hypothetical protein PENNAL_c0033G06680 [Penicillium nalgiovense]|uniref:Uncharacterized protein n=1 Tax=Penicillium nalgiovense TaxID=60175 RepID=A0A1V6Y7G9_PENNA|nr:hypothetical protein PENNAL_c0033G06680 [Penicillium nalgiovense]